MIGDVYTKRNHQQEPTVNPMGTTQKVSIDSTPEVIMEQGTQRDSVPMELTKNTMSNSQSQDLDIILMGLFYMVISLKEGLTAYMVLFLITTYLCLRIYR